MNNDSLLELITEKYDNEISVYKLITLESAILENKILNAYVDEITKNYFSISVSIKRTIKKLTISSYL